MEYLNSAKDPIIWIYFGLIYYIEQNPTTTHLIIAIIGGGLFTYSYFYKQKKFETTNAKRIETLLELWEKIVMVRRLTKLLLTEHQLATKEQSEKRLKENIPKANDSWNELYEFLEKRKVILPEKIFNIAIKLKHENLKNLSKLCEYNSTEIKDEYLNTFYQEALDSIENEIPKLEEELKKEIDSYL
jgi:hypothetical protein